MPPRYQLFSVWPDQALAFTTAVERFARLAARARAGMAVHFQLSVTSWRLLRLVARAGPKASPTELARRLKVSRPSVAETAARLREQGFLTVGCLRDDHRVRLLALTEEGEACLSEIDAGMEILLLEMTNDVPRENLVAATRILNGMSRRLRECTNVLGRPPPSRSTG